MRIYSKNQPLDFYFVLGGGPINLNPHILRFNIVASTTKGCGINKSTTY